MMNVDIELVESQWKHLRSKIKQRWQALTTEEIQHTGGNTDMLVDLLRDRYGYSKRYAEDEVRQFLRHNTTERNEPIDRLITHIHPMRRRLSH
jgi:uncharacterized protein YjbJ (UPF0337 family)